MGPPGDPAALFADAGLQRRADGNLHFGGVDLAAVAAAVATPCYVYSAEIIRARYSELRSAFRSIPHQIHYAVKANGNLAVLNVLGELGAGADIVSGGELARVRRAGMSPAHVVFSGVGKTERELETAVEADIGSINLESEEELALLQRVSAGRTTAQPVRVGIRVNPDLTADTHPYVATGAAGIKFGVSAAQAETMAARIATDDRLVLSTLAMHLGSQLLDPDIYADGARRLLALRERLPGPARQAITAIDIGGGFGIRYVDESPLTPAALAGALEPVLAGSGLELHLEPGRFLVGSAGLLVTRVLYRKESGGKRFVVVDAAMNDLLRPSIYRAKHAVVECRARQRPSGRVDIVGPVCETGDFLAIDQALPEVRPGELLALLCVGAYGFAMASNYNSRLRPPEVLIDRGRFGVVRPRETVEHLLGSEIRDPFAGEHP